jgi:hypothetical protein
MITIWDWHNDEYNRIKHFIPDSFRYVGSEIPDFDLLIVPDGNWLAQIPIEKRDMVIVVPCVQTVDHIKRLGYKYAFTKDSAQHQLWGEGSIIVPPIVEDKGNEHNPSIDLATFVHAYQRRDEQGYNFSVKAGAHIFGMDADLKADYDYLPKCKYIIHSKTIGYLCNSVVKAISYRVPVIFSRESFDRGYKDYLTPDYDCFVVDTPNQAKHIINTGTDIRENLKQTINKIQNQYEKVHLDISNCLNQLQKG